MIQCIHVMPRQQQLGPLQRDAHAKKDVAYLLTDRTQDTCVLAQSLPLLARYVNVHLCNSGLKCDRVSLTGLFENLNRDRSSTNGGWHKGRYRVTSMRLRDAMGAFDAARLHHRQGFVIGHKIASRA